MLTLTYYGHSAFKIENNKHTILIDPFISGNPNATVEPVDLNPDFILVTHGHGDHLGDTINIAKRTRATVIAPFELIGYCSQKGVENTHPMHIGGDAKFPFGELKLTQALHGSASPDGIYTGNPCGFLVTIDNKTIYHAGDTGIFGDMKLIGELNDIDVALLPIGGNFTMNISDAVVALSMLKAKLGIPMHYNTFEVIKADPNEFVNQAANKGLNAQVMEFGETLEV